MNVNDLMTADPISVTESTNLLSTKERMKVARVRHLPVVRGKHVIGIVTHRDILSASPSIIAEIDVQLRENLLSQIPVSAVLNERLITVYKETNVIKAIDLMLLHKLGCLPVVDEKKELVGILTESDFLKLTKTFLEAARNVLVG